MSSSHGSDVKCCDWHPQLGIIASGSKDNQQPIKLWDPKTGQSLTTLHAHKSTVMDLKWNKNGNWFMTASRDHFLKLFDIRNLSQVVQTFRGHKKEASCIAWHPHHEGLIASGGSDGAILFWHVGADKEVGAIDAAHESIVWTLDWHPLGHILCSGSNDHTSKFWTRNRPGDLMKDKYNLNTLPAGLPGMEDNEIDEMSCIPGMAPEDRVEGLPAVGENLLLFKQESNDGIIPGLDDDLLDPEAKKKKPAKKQPYAKPIPKNFMAQWNETGMTPEEEEEALEGYGTESVLDPINQLINKFIEQQPGVKKLEELEPTAVVVFGKVLPVRPGQKLYKKIFKGREALNKYIRSGKIKELQDVLPIMDSDGEGGESDSDSSSMELDPPNDDDDTTQASFPDSNLDFGKMDMDFRRFGRGGPMDAEMDFRNAGGMGRDMDLRFQSRDQNFRSSNQVFDEDLRNPPNMPPPLMGPNFRSMDDRRDKMIDGDGRGRDLDLRHQFGGSDFGQGNNFPGGDSRMNFHQRNNFNSRDMDFRNFDDRNNRGSFQRNELDFRGRDFEDRYDDRENMGNSKDSSFDERPNFNNSSNSFHGNQRWDEGPSQDNNWGNRPPPLMAANIWENSDMDFRNFGNRGFQGNGGPNNFGARGKMRGGRNQNSRSRPRRGRGRFPKN
ncbi:hypothetical protein RUM43_014406 [Polyplax serrata]|uniref:WDR33 n=1 Tax=Polyplax serrata TaxID=468196 RepID=A0AAN8NPR8_POLSC